MATFPLSYSYLTAALFSSCSKELNQWEALTEYGQSKGHNNPYLVLECAWRVSNWAAMKDALGQVCTCPLPPPRNGVCLYPKARTLNSRVSCLNVQLDV